MALGLPFWKTSNKMNISYTTKIANEQDIHNHLVECKDSFNPPLDKTVCIQDYSRKIYNRAITFEAWAENRLIGCVAAYFNNSENNSGFITNVSVTMDYIGKGVASNLMIACIKYACENQFKEIILEVCKKSTGAIHLYEKLNFQKIECKNDLIIMKHYLN